MYYIQGNRSPILIPHVFSGMETNCLKKGYLFAMKRVWRKKNGGLEAGNPTIKGWDLERKAWKLLRNG